MKEQVRELFKQGKSIEEIGSEVKRSKDSLVKLLKDELRPQTVAMRQKGYSLQEIINTLGIGRKAINLWTKGIELTDEQIMEIRNKHHYNVDVLTKEDAVSYYLLGAWMSDGNVKVRKDRPNAKTISIAAKDKDWIELINEFIGSETPIRPHGTNCHRVQYHSTEMANWLISKGCGPRKSLTLKFPEVPKQYLPDFLRGVWDGDGSLMFANRFRQDRQCWEQQRSASVSSGSKDFLLALQQELVELGISSHLSEKRQKPRMIVDHWVEKESITFELRLTNGEDAYNLCKLLYYPNNPLVMPRKAAIAKAIIEDWEKPFYCKMCKTELHLSKTQRVQKYCDDCWAQKERERCRIKDAKRREKRKADKLNSNLSAFSGSTSELSITR